MSELQVVLDGRGARPEERAVAAATLLAQVDQTLLDPATASLRRDIPLLVVPGRAALARGAVRRVLADLATPGRCLTCVLLPGDGLLRVAAWAPRWLADWQGSLADLVDADLAFDREHLPTGSPLARAWLRADAVGVSAAADVGADPAGWARRTGLLLDRDAVVASVRAPLGAARRRMARRGQRRSRDQVLR
ncbi:hypothetical protein [Ornithinimicrobium avium]|uniref:Uncharacterized protein n=1 Tax=Ornithinimicrobium avium TaxID=2283195 RepID=A0A345NNZ9_9MICO|nr:hypothetical protein [Ornithinimicrobium avium]AXH96757.1 hypothetical protein DV701_12070 [Ornithinimicrobium avium]